MHTESGEPASQVESEESQFQHYVPKLYLKAWATTVNKRPNRLWIYEKGKKPYTGSLRKTAGADNAYAVRRNGKRDIGLVEDFLSAEETRQARVIEKIRRHVPITPADRTTIAEFLGFMTRRVSFIQDKAEATVKESLPLIIDELRHLAQSRDTEEKRRIALANIAKVEVEASRDPRSIGALVLLEPTKLVKVLLNMDWGFLRDGRSMIVTSDNPFVYDRRRGIGKIETGHAIIPISPSIWLHAMHWTKYRNGYFEMPSHLVDDINLRVIRSAYKQVYADRNEPEIEHLVNEYIGVDL